MHTQTQNNISFPSFFSFLPRAPYFSNCLNYTVFSCLEDFNILLEHSRISRIQFRPLNRAVWIATSKYTYGGSRLEGSSGVFFVLLLPRAKVKTEECFHSFYLLDMHFLSGPQSVFSLLCVMCGEEQSLTKPCPMLWPQALPPFS